jgi:glycerophosphoryl diester phosphodiesterase
VDVTYSIFRDKMNYLSPAKPRIFAHRGFVKSGKDENATSSFFAAISAGATHIETDVRVTRDLVPVLLHDATLQAAAGDERALADVNWHEIKDIRLSNGGRLLSLEEALIVFGTAFFNIDLKESAAVGPVCDVIRKVKAQNRVLLASFSQVRVEKAMKLLKGRSVASAGSSRVVALKLLSALGLPITGLAKGLVAVQVPVRQNGLRFDTKQFIRAMHKVGLEVHFWTINDPAEMKRLVALGADGIVTDRTDLAVAALR